MPASGPLPVDVPGVVSGWDALLSRFGTIVDGRGAGAGDRLRQRGLPGGRDGRPPNGRTAPSGWRRIRPRRATFLPGGQAPVMGEIFREPAARRQPGAHRRASGKDAFYTGAIAAGDRRRPAGARRAARPPTTWPRTPPTGSNRSRTTYRGYDVHEMPPSTQGFVALEMLNILEGFDIAAMGHNSADYLHVVAEAKKIAFADRGAYLADRGVRAAGRCWRRCCRRSTRRARRQDIDMARAGSLSPPAP